MSHESQSRPPMYTQLEVSAAAPVRPAAGRDRDDRKQTELLTNILTSVERQNELLEELVGTLCGQQRQRTKELKEWRTANPALVRNCRRAAETLSRVQTEFLRTMTHEVNDNPEGLVDGEFVLSEFVDRFGPRMAHLNGVLQVLAQISGNPGRLMAVELVHTFAEDGLRLDGAVYSPAAGTTAGFGIDGLLVLHGTGSSFYASRFLTYIAERAVAWGATCLIANTRGHDQVTTALVQHADGSTSSRRIGSAYEKVEECRLDIRAWLQLLSSRGCRRLAILGHSLGAVKAVYAAANESLPNVQALIAVSPPRLSYSHFAASVRGPGFLAELAAAEAHVAAGNPEAIMDIHFPLPYLITAAGYVDKYGRDERYNLLNLVDHLRVPTLFTFGGTEVQQGIAFRGTTESLEEKKSAGANLTTAVIAGGDHHYTGVQGDLLTTIDRWLGKTLPKSP